MKTKSCFCEILVYCLAIKKLITKFIRRLPIVKICLWFIRHYISQMVCKSLKTQQFLNSFSSFHSRACSEFFWCWGTNQRCWAFVSTNTVTLLTSNRAQYMAGGIQGPSDWITRTNKSTNAHVLGQSHLQEFCFYWQQSFLVVLQLCSVIINTHDIFWNIFCYLQRSQRW